MSIHPAKRANGRIRAIILFSSVLALVGVVFAVVQYMDMGEQQYRRAGKSGTSTRPAGASIGPDDAPGLTVREGMPQLGVGGKSSIRIYAPDSDVARMEILIREWRPTGRTDEEFELIEPEIRLRTPGGQLIRVLADRGVVAMRRVGGGSYDPRHGRLEGNIRFEMDRLSAEEREALPEELRDARPTPDRLVEATLEDIEFDLEASRIQTSGRFRAEAAEGSIEGVGLTVRYDEINSRVEQLEIQQGVQIVLKRVGRSLQIALPGQTEVVPQDGPTGLDAFVAAEDTPLETPEPPPTHDADGVPYLEFEAPAEQKAESQRPTETYVARFDGGVAIEETDREGVVSRLESDTLSFLFDLGRRQRAVANRGGLADGAAGNEPADAPNREVVLTWSGRFRISFVDEAVPGAAARLQVSATGDPVYLRNRAGSALCGSLEYHNETQNVWLRGDKDTGDVIVESAGTGQVVGRELYFDRAGGRLEVQGPGQLAADRPKQPLVETPGGTAPPAAEDETMRIRFERLLTATFAQETAEIVDSVTGQTLAEQYEYLQSAEFQGDVQVTQAEDAVSADEITVVFRRPERSGRRVGDIDQVAAVRDVRLRHGDDDIRCEVMDVTLDRDERGGISPRQARAEGEVVATRGPRRISATEGMLVDLRLYEKVLPPAAAVERGRTDAETASELPTVFEPGLRRLQAFGSVSVQDPARSLDLTSDSLDCSFVPDPETGEQVIDRARLASGESGSPASLQMEDFSIQGRTINLDAGRQDAQVPGAGRLSFSSRIDLDGREVDPPIPIAVTWTEGMMFQGAANEAAFIGGVHAASSESTLDCERLRLEFEDIERVADPSPKRDWWIFTPLFDRADKARDGLGISGPKSARKRLRVLNAEGNAVARMANHDARSGALVSRARLAGDHIDLDMDRSFARMDCPGSLLIEDYKVQPPRGEPADERTDPFGRIGGEGSSQTYLKWARAMRCDLETRTAAFDQDVTLRHVTGDYLMAFGEFARSKPESADGKPEGRDARLSCQTLFAQFQRVADDGSAAGTGIGSLSGFALDKFQAEGQTLFKDGDVSAMAHRVTYDKAGSLLMMFGTPADPQTDTPAVPARIYQEGTRFRYFTGSVLSWNREAGLIEVLDSGGFAR